MTWPHPSTHPSTKSYTHLWVGDSTTDFKSSNRIELFWLVQVLSNFYWFQGSHPGGVAGGWIGVGAGMGVWEVSHACTCTHACTHACCKHDKHVCLHVSGHLQISIHVYMCVHACVYVWGHPHMPPDAPTHLPPPQSCTGSPKHQNSISLELIEIIWFCLKILYLWTLLNSYRL